MPDARYTAGELDELDHIARQIDIDATVERVWELVRRPGWFINDGTVDPEPDLRDDGGVAVLHHPSWGEFHLKAVELDEPRYAAFRWFETPYRGESTPSTLVEFWIEERDEGGVTLRVLESGFSQLSDDPAEWLRRREGNVAGWRTELGTAKAFVEGRATSSGPEPGAEPVASPGPEPAPGPDAGRTGRPDA
ncbi:ATPase [Streptomyces sp. AJS327]|uniref:ATPase n=1 Tax=Streptomyces sp. AJS327 TaxID=2545265 RepID=UPI0027E50D50|nr:ATPase [Streptomyces sp. AJS327]